ncbi:hypothetical protein EDB92DRAFT_1870603 [Lactarius akahatsu]|uniref:Uncharacterized protein n=1 Tax=Lactarius akahatsu TaxID=416441 RepID=A0AAD4LET3_9AGAM|nr:hypothetical protein EDB92DRAFT_1870603 [Lactarius akahatsu]
MSSNIPSSRRTSSSPSVTRGATARSAVNPRVSASLHSTRRASIKSPTPPRLSPDAPEVLAASLKRETEEKERLLVQLQNKDQTISSLSEENSSVSTALHTAETRLYEFYAEQARMDEELSARIEVTEKLRAQVRELEKEKRDLHRRYNEQTDTFESERQAFYDNEQHLKSRIQSLTQARRLPPVPRSPTVPDMSETDTEEEEDEPVQPSISSQEKDLDAEPAEMTALRLELSTLSTSHASLQSTLVLLQTQLVDLKRVNNQLQEENESYNILLREKTLSGQYDLFRQVNGDRSNSGDEDDQTDNMGDFRSINSGAHSSQLGTLDEHPDEEVPTSRLGNRSRRPYGSIGRDGSARGKRSRQGRGHGGSSHSPPPRGESLAGLPITGPGLDLAAELGRAENKDILEGQADDVSGPRKKSSSDIRKVSGAEAGMEPHNEVDTLRSEIKSLKDANKALSLYASKIIDRIIAQEGFEHVLAVDYEAEAPATPMASPDPSAEADKKPKRRNTLFSRSNTNPAPRTEKLTTFDSPPLGTTPPSRANRRSLSFDWRSFAPFVSGDKDKKPEANPNLRPLTLKPGSISGARKLETQEDEEDRRERERLNATMKLMGIEKSPVLPQIQNSYSTPETPPAAAEGVTSPSLVSRFSLFRRSTATSDTATISSPAEEPRQGNTANLTHDTLVRAQAEESLAALDAQERVLGTELAKGGGSGFTEILPRRKSGSRRSHTSGGRQR